jgi:hypothetical protein
MSFFFSLFIGVTAMASFTVQERPHLQSFTESLHQADAVTALFKSTMTSPIPGKKFLPLWKANEKMLTELERKFSDSIPFVRGEIEDEKVMNGIMTYLELALLKVRFEAQQKKPMSWSKIQAQWQAWFTFAADFPYDEASMVGLKVAGVIRSLLLDEMEKLQTQHQDEIAAADAFRSWFLQVRAPWPVDRMVLSESRRLLKPAMMKIAEKVALALQKNPYQSSEDVVKSLHAQDMDEAHYLNSMWKPAEIELMKTEITRVGRLQLRLAAAVFAHKKSAPAKSVDQFISAGLLERAPVNYSTGKPFTLTDI